MLVEWGLNIEEDSSADNQIYLINFAITNSCRNKKKVILCMEMLKYNLLQIITESN